MAKGRSRTWTGPVPADEDRCTRNDGKSWRCYAPRHPGSVYCHAHHLAYTAKCKAAASRASARARPKQNPQTPFRKIPTTRSSDLEPGQIWAYFQNPTKIPRHYARIDRKLPSQSSVVATPLIPHPVLEEETDRVFSCGTFRPSPKKPMMVMDASAFAFQVVGFKVLHWMGIPFYRIFPNKGEVWAVENDKLVEVLSDFSEEEGVTVAGLVPVERRNGVYGRHLHEGFRLVQTFERREMVVFSHRVKAERVDGGDGNNQLWKVTPS